MSRPIDDIESAVQEETARHQESQEKANGILARFMEGNVRAKTAVDSYRQADKALKRKPKNA